MSIGTNKEYINARKRLKVLLRSDHEDQEVCAEICTLVTDFPEFSDAFPEVQSIVQQTKSTTSMKSPPQAAKRSTIQNFVGFVSFCSGISPERKLEISWFLVCGAICWLHQLELLGNRVEIHANSGSLDSVFFFIHAAFSPLFRTNFWSALSAQWSSCAMAACALIMHGTMQCHKIFSDIAYNRRVSVVRVTQDLMSFLIGDFLRCLVVYFFFSGIFLVIGKSMSV